jgi:methyl-accepting chemotaxis protein
MNESTHQVQDASQTMTADSRAIMEAVDSLHKETDTIKQGMDEMGRSAEKIQITGDALSEISVLMETSIGEIGRQVDQFEV